MMQEKPRKVWTIILFSFIALFWITIIVLQELSIGRPQEVIYVSEPTLIIPMVDPTKAHVPTSPISKIPASTDTKNEKATKDGNKKK
jgi:hypothetical protein